MRMRLLFPLAAFILICLASLGDTEAQTSDCRILLNASSGNNTSLLPGDCLWSPSGDYTLIMQPDGSLALYDLQNPTTAIWFATSDGAAPGVTAAIQEDGNFVVYKGAAPIWWSGATLPPGVPAGFLGHFFLMVQDDGSVAVYKGTGPNDPARALTWSSRSLPEGYAPSRQIAALPATSDSRIELGRGDIPSLCSKIEWRQVHNTTLVTSRQQWIAYASVSMPNTQAFQNQIKDCALISAGAAGIAAIYTSPEAAKPTFLASFKQCMRAKAIDAAASNVTLSIETSCVDW